MQGLGSGTAVSQADSPVVDSEGEDKRAESLMESTRELVKPSYVA